MKKLLFTHSYFLRFDPKQWKSGRPYAPLGTLYAAALAREKGHEVFFHDVQFARSAAEIAEPLQKNLPDCLVIYDDGFNYLTKMCLTNMREAAYSMIRLAKQQGCTVIMSNSDATDHYDQYIHAGADYILLGEAEQTLVELLQELEKPNGELFSVQGLAFLHCGAIVKTSRREVMKDLDQLPFPAWDLIDMEPYRQSWLKNAGYFSINIGTTRGCPFKCNWCAKPIYGNRYNSRSPQNVVKELKMLKEKFGFDHVWFCDDIFGLKPGWVIEFAALARKEDLHFRFKIQSRADLLLQPAYVEALALAGCETAWIGAESGSQKILDAMDKGIRTEQIAQATALLKAHQIAPCFFIQFGYLGETREDIAKTLKMIRQLKPSEIGVSVSYPLPGTGFYEKVKSQLKSKSNWTDSDELELMFRNTYSPLFYKKLHRYVHHRFRLQKGWQAGKEMIRAPLSFQWKQCRMVLGSLFYWPATIVYGLQMKRHAHE